MHKKAKPRRDPLAADRTQHFNSDGNKTTTNRQEEEGRKKKGTGANFCVPNLDDIDQAVHACGHSSNGALRILLEWRRENP